jgi:uncharacterized membrane protein YqhA
LWQSRLVVIIAVVASVLVSIGVFFITTVDMVIMLSHLAQYADLSLAAEARTSLRLSLVAEVVAIVDGYLLAAIMLILALGLYELFASKIGWLEGSEERASRLLVIHSFDDLKDRLARVVLLILIVKFFQQAVRLKYNDTQDLLFLALGILLIGGALYLTRHRASKDHYS